MIDLKFTFFTNFFLQSPNMNDFYNAAETTVVKVLFGQSATIFNNQVSFI